MPWRTETQQASLPHTASGDVLANSHSLAVTAATGCSQKLHSWPYMEHCWALVLWSDLAEKIMQSRSPRKWCHSLAHTLDGEGVKWDGTSAHKPVTGWCKGHNDGSQQPIVHFKGCQVMCYTGWCVWSSAPRPKHRWDSYHQQETVQLSVNEKCILGKWMHLFHINNTFSRGCL